MRALSGNATQSEPGMRIGIDFDSTIARIDEPWLDKLNAARGTSYRAEDWSDWDLAFLDPFDRPVFLSLLTPDIYEGVQPYPGAPQAIQHLSAEPGVELVCVTTNPPDQADAFLSAKRKWLQEHVPELSDSIFVTQSKFGIGLDILIDDAPHHHRHGDYIPVLVERPWNSGVTAALRFKDWADGESLLLRLIQELRSAKRDNK